MLWKTKWLCLLTNIPQADFLRSPSALCPGDWPIGEPLDSDTAIRDLTHSRYTVTLMMLFNLSSTVVCMGARPSTRCLARHSPLIDSILVVKVPHGMASLVGGA